MAEVTDHTKLTTVENIDICLGKGKFEDTDQEWFLTFEQQLDIVVIRPQKLRHFIRSLNEIATYLKLPEETQEDVNQLQFFDLDTLEVPLTTD